MPISRNRRDAHLDGFAVLDHRQHLVEDVVGEFLRDAEVANFGDGLQTGADAGDRAVVVGALNVDGLREAAFELREVSRVRQNTHRFRS